MIYALILAAGLIPFHGTAISQAPSGDAIIRNDAITNTLAPTTARYRLAPNLHLVPGAGIDGFLDRSTTPWTLRDPVAAARFAPGLPDAGRVQALDIGMRTPHAPLVDQFGNRVDLHDSFLGKTVLLSFIFTRCPDRTLCPAISGKFAYLQTRLDPAHFALVEVSLDPPYDSPSVLQDYGKQYGSDPKIWHLLTGTGSTTNRVLNQFGIDSLRLSSANFLHNDKLFIITQTGTIAYIVQTADWDPQGVIAEASSVAGMASNPWERFKLSLVANVVAFCGGSAAAGVVALETTLFAIITLFVTAGLLWARHALWGSRAK